MCATDDGVVIINTPQSTSGPAPLSRGANELILIPREPSRPRYFAVKISTIKLKIENREKKRKATKKQKTKD